MADVMMGTLCCGRKSCIFQTLLALILAFMEACYYVSMSTRRRRNLEILSSMLVFSNSGDIESMEDRLECPFSNIEL